MEGWQRRGRYHVVRQAVPDGGSRDREGPAADGWQFHGRYLQTIGPSRPEGTSTRQIGVTNQLTQVWRRSSISGLVHEHGRLEPYSPEPGANGGWWVRRRCGRSDAGRRWAVITRSSPTEDAGTTILGQLLVFLSDLAILLFLTVLMWMCILLY